MPEAPLERVTEFACGELGSKPEPETMTRSGEGELFEFELEGTEITTALSETTGGATTVATSVATPLLPPKEVTTAVRAPKLVGGLVKETVREVSVAESTAAEAPRLSEIELLLPSRSKPEPESVSEGALLAIFSSWFGETAGARTTVATCTGLVSLLARPKEVTEATESAPRGNGEEEEKETVSEVGVAAETELGTGGSKTTEFPLLALAGSKPEPKSTIEGALLATFVFVEVSGITRGRARTVATCTGSPLEPPNDDPKLETFARRGPKSGAC